MAVPNRGFLKVGNRKCWTVHGTNMRNHAKFRADWSNRCWDIAIFGLLWWRLPPSRIFEISKIWNFKILTWIEQFRQNLTQRRNLIFLTVLTVEKWKKLKSKMAAATILKDRKIEIARQRFYRSLRNLARWRNSTLVTRTIVKICIFKNPKWRRLPS